LDPGSWAPLAQPASAAVVGGLVPAYLAFMSLGSIPKGLPEVASGSAGPKTAPGLRGLLATAVGLFAALALGGSVLLWAHYGTTVFFETIRAGFTACFG
jgi:hypothetical protein